MKTRTVTAPAAVAALRRALRAAARTNAPRYAQLRDALLRGIEAGHWRPGDRLPTESELCAAAPFSLGTVQRALRALVDEGVVTRQQGSGSYVSSAHGRIDDVAHCRFLADDAKSFLPVYSRVRFRGRATGTGPWTPYFPDRGARTIRLDRLLGVNGEFNVYSRFYFDGARFKQLASRPFLELTGANLKALLREELHVPAIGLVQTFMITRIPRDIAGHIGLAANATGGVLECVGWARGNDCIYFQQMFFPPSRRKWVPYPAIAAAE